MTIEEYVFQKVQINPDKLAACGFTLSGSSWTYETDFCGGDFHAILTVNSSLRLSGTVIDNETEDEYLPLRIKDAAGTFVHGVREAYLALLQDVAVRIGTPVPFHSDQANRIAIRIMERYGDSLEFPWKKENGDSSDTAVIRHPDNQKWYGLFMYIPETSLKTDEEKKAARRAAEEEKIWRAEERKKREELKKAGKKVPPLKRSKSSSAAPEDPWKVDVINLKIRQEDRQTLWQEPGIFPSFHMSQKTWISVRLDNTLSDDRILQLADQSFILTSRGGTHSSKLPGQKKSWIVPANPKYYDIISVFRETDDTFWKQGKGIETGDTVYMYVAVPYSAILYKCTVTQAYSASVHTDIKGNPTSASRNLMDIHIDARYSPKFCTLDKMKEFGVTTVRGPRFMPEELKKYLES